MKTVIQTSEEYKAPVVKIVSVALSHNILFESPNYTQTDPVEDEMQ